MSVYVCRVCGYRATVRSQFELFFCPRCEGEDTLEPEDAYDPEPSQLVCAGCRYRVDARAAGDELHDAPRLTPDDPCPRCGRVALAAVDAIDRRASVQREVVVAPEYGVARAAAARVLERHWTGEMPVDVHEIAVAVGLTVVTSQFGHQGRLAGELIQVPDEEPLVARRFAIAHEIGHHELRHQVTEEKIEAEANAFASELLMPRGRLRRAVEVGLTLDELRDLFDVSSQALTYALDAAKLTNKIVTAR